MMPPEMVEILIRSDPSPIAKVRVLPDEDATGCFHIRSTMVPVNVLAVRLPLKSFGIEYSTVPLAVSMVARLLPMPVRAIAPDMLEAFSAWELP